jgi:predicted RNA binding protein with dsRBD fold (UPF0201 family)
MIELHLSARVFPSEDIERIKKIFCFFYPFSNFTIIDTPRELFQEISASATGIDAIHFLFTQSRRQQTVSAIRMALIEQVDSSSNSLEFMIHKQFLTQKRINICEREDESALGPIFVRISAKHIRPIFDYLFPPSEGESLLEATEIPQE